MNMMNTNRSQFETFFQGWLVRQQSYLEQLRAATLKSEESSSRGDDDDVDLIRRVVAHYQQYYEEKSRIANHDVSLVFSPPWFSSLERSFFWIAGFKPALAFRIVSRCIHDMTQLLDKEFSTKLHQQTGAGKGNMRRPRRAGPSMPAPILALRMVLQPMLYFRSFHSKGVGKLLPNVTYYRHHACLNFRYSKEQVKAMERLQVETAIEERELENEMARIQESVAGPAIVSATRGAQISMVDGKHDDQLGVAIETLRAEMEVVLGNADMLRSRTAERVVEILMPVQNIKFLAAVTQLFTEMRMWGWHMEGARR